MNDTAQLATAAETDPNAALDNAASAFKAFDEGEPIKRPRDDQGRFAATEPQEDEYEAEEPQEADTEAEDEDGVEAADDDSAQPMPPSWPADQAEHWNSLPPETREFIAAREGERERAVNAKFQEAAIARKEATLERQETANNRKQLIEAYQAVEGLLQPVEPDPYAFGLGTGQYNREAYDMAVMQYRQQVNALEQVKAERQHLAQQEAQEAEQQFMAHKAEVDRQFTPILLELEPGISDTVKGEAFLQSVIEYGKQAGIDPERFSEESLRTVTAAELVLIRKAQLYDELKSKAPAPKPKQAGPAVRPGVSSPRSAQKAATRSRAFERLNREGSIEAGAAVFKNFV
jgi:hypothetical protein